MTGYGRLFIAVAVILLLLPLPAYISPPTQETPPPPPPTDDVDGGAPSAPTDSDTETAAVFRVLCGDEVVSLDERDFLIRTLAMEMSPATHEEALKAQTVAAYTYYARRREAQSKKADPDLKGADFATPNDKFPNEYSEEKLRERWGKQYDENYAKIAAAVEAVHGVTITHNGALIDAVYHAISSGSTESADTVWGSDVPYLQAVASPGDRLSQGFESESRHTVEEVRTILTRELPDVALGDDPTSWFGEPTLSAAGTVAQQPIGDRQLAGTRVRQLFGLRSAAFTVTYAESAFTFAVRGYGHGVGMSQHGADYLAQQGYTYDEILRYYYTDVEVNLPR